MSVVFGIAIYFVCWWITLFAILPFGVRTQAEEGHVVIGSEGSAPSNPGMGRKLIITTLVSAVIFAIIYVLMVYKPITLDDIPFLPRFEPVR